MRQGAIYGEDGLPMADLVAVLMPVKTEPAPAPHHRKIHWLEVLQDDNIAFEIGCYAGLASATRSLRLSHAESKSLLTALVRVQAFHAALVELGSPVCLQNLTGHADLNGQRGVVVQCPTAGLVGVRLCSGKEVAVQVFKVMSLTGPLGPLAHLGPGPFGPFGPGTHWAHLGPGPIGPIG